jgi:methyl-accepting chemotaxis protein
MPASRQALPARLERAALTDVLYWYDFAPNRACNAFWCAMPGTRIIAILDEIGQISRTPRVRELALELGKLIASEMGMTREAVSRLKDQTTTAIVDTELTLDDEIQLLKKDIQLLSATFAEFNKSVVERRNQIDEREERISGRVHTLANHMMAVEQKVNELADLITQIAEQLTDYHDSNDHDSDASSDDQLLIDPYDHR